jgi:tripartite-type tricarboxylate transporter receptor subunit TctC
LRESGAAGNIAATEEWMVRIATLVGSCAVLCAAGAACGQNYPAKPIHVLTYDSGSGGDVVARVIGQGLTEALGEQIVVENRGGAGGAIAAEYVAKSAPDAYTLLFYGNNIWLLPFLRDRVPYDPVKDLAPVTLATSSPQVIVVNPALPVSSVKDLITLAKSKPGELKCAMGGTGGPAHLAAELFKAMAGIDVVSVPYKSAGPALNDLIAGDVQMQFPVVASGMPHVKAGRLKALAVTSAQPSGLVPALPTVAASGLLGYESVAMYGMFAPAKTDPALVARLNQEIVRVLASDEVQRRLSPIVDVVGSSPDQFAAKIRVEMSVMGKVIKDAGIRAE